MSENLMRVGQTGDAMPPLSRSVENGCRQLPQNIAMPRGFQCAPVGVNGFTDSVSAVCVEFRDVNPEAVSSPGRAPN